MKLLGFSSPGSLGLIPLMLGGIGCSGRACQQSGTHGGHWPVLNLPAYWVSVENKLLLTPCANNSTKPFLPHSAVFSTFNSQKG